MTNKTKKQMNKAEMKKTKGGSAFVKMERKDKMLAPNTKASSIRLGIQNTSTTAP